VSAGELVIALIELELEPSPRDLVENTLWLLEASPECLRTLRLEEL